MDRYYKFYERQIKVGMTIAFILFVVFFMVEVLKR